MNVAVTRAAEGFPRRAFTVEDIRRMIEAGVISADEKFELIEGELVMMAAKHIVHDKIKNALVVSIARALPQDLALCVENSLQLADNILVEPDIAIIANSVYQADPKSFARPGAEDVRLLIEIAASSLAYDRGLKARLYARHGVREFWVIDADQRMTFVHTDPSEEAWSSIVERGPQDELTTPALPGFSLRLGAIDR
jgi:Uma2 family endonuclease